MTSKRELGDVLRDAFPTYTAPPSLHQWARDRAAEADRQALAPSDRTIAYSTRVARLSWYAAGLLAASVLGWVTSNAYRVHTQSSTAEEALVVELVDTHVRSLMGDHLLDVQSTDQHTVKPWFAGKADFVPRVVDLKAKGFPLLGGRIEYVGGHTTAALVYGLRRHVVNVFIWPSVASEDPAAARRYRGYSLQHWVTDGLSYWVVTDASPADLEAFRQDYAPSP